MDKLQCEQNCIHCPVCGHKEQFKEYFKQHIALRKESILFDSQPTCKFYLNENNIERKHTHDISDIYNKVKEATKKEPIVFGSKDDLKKLHNSKIDDEYMVTKDDYYDGRIQPSSKELDELIKGLFPNIQIYRF